MILSSSKASNKVTELQVSKISHTSESDERANFRKTLRMSVRGLFPGRSKDPQLELQIFLWDVLLSKNGLVKANLQ